MKTYFLNSILDSVSRLTDLKNLERSLKSGLYSYDEYAVERGESNEPVMSFRGELLFNKRGKVVGTLYIPQYALLAGERVGDAVYELVFFQRPKQQLLKSYWYIKKSDSKPSVEGDYAGFTSMARCDKIEFTKKSLSLFLRKK